MAENCCGEAVPIWMFAFAGETEKETSVGAVTVKAVEPLMLPTVAEIFAEPWVFELARPEALMVATAGASEAHVAEFVRFPVVPSL